TVHDGGGNVASDSSFSVFTIAGWIVTASAGAHGTIAPNGATQYPENATPYYTITPDAGYHVADVVVGGIGSVGAVTSYTFAPLTSDHTITPSFAINTYTLNVTTSGSGTVVKN